MSDRHYTQERVEVAKAYPGKKWAQKVLGMSDAQVHEIYVSIMNRQAKKCDKSEEKKCD